jgi:hypothetical protein
VELVAERECGECSVCCVLLNVDTPEFRKMPHAACAHLGEGGKGCTIHETRYPVCRVYHCGWRYLKGLGEEWRPDKSGVLIDFQSEGLPAHYPKRPGIRLTVAGPIETVFHPGFIAFVAGLIAAEIPIVLAIPGPPAHFPAYTFLNDALRDAVMAKDAARIEAGLRSLLAGLEGHVFSPVVHRHGTGG